MRLAHHAERQAKNAQWRKAIFKKTPNRNHAQAHRNPGWIANLQQHLASNQKQANQHARSDRRIPCPDAPHQISRQDEACPDRQHPKHVTQAPWQQRERNNDCQHSRQVHADHHHMVQRLRGGGVHLRVALKCPYQVARFVWIGVPQQTPRAVINTSEIRHRVRGDAFEGEALYHKQQAAENEPNQTIEACPLCNFRTGIGCHRHRHRDSWFKRAIVLSGLLPRIVDHGLEQRLPTKKRFAQKMNRSRSDSIITFGFPEVASPAMRG